LKYNEQYKIRFDFNPSFQCVLAKPFGWMTILDLFANSRDYKEGDEVLFYYRKSNADKCIEHINKMRRSIHD
jgi:hypothetical protein